MFSNHIITSLLHAEEINLRSHYQIASLFFESSEKAQDETDAAILKMLGGILSMTYSLDEHTFKPLLILNDSNRSFSLDDLRESDLEAIRHAAEITKSVSIQTRLSHVAWTSSNDYQDGIAAAQGYIKIFEEKFDTTNWVECNDAIQCAFYIASSLGKKTEIYKIVRETINKKLREMDGKDPLFLSISLLETVIADASHRELEEYSQIVSKLARKNIDSQNSNIYVADSTYSVQCSVLKKQKKTNEQDNATIEYAAYYEEIADKLSKNQQFQQAANMLKKACMIIRQVDKEKLLDLRLKLAELQRKAMGQMQPVPFEFNAAPTYKKVDALFEGLPLREAIVQLGWIAPIYKIGDVKKEVFEKKNKFLFSSLFAGNIVNDDGQIVQNIPPLNSVDEDADNEVVQKLMVRHVSENRSMISAMTLGRGLCYFQQFDGLTRDELEFLVKNNAIVPKGREDIIMEGLLQGLKGNLYVAMHLLLPQTEQIFRNLVEICGDTTTFLNGDGTESYKPLSALFKSEKLHECYDPNLIFTFQSIMTDPAGENLRNLNAHGVLEPDIGNGGSALYFLCLLIRLLTIYSIEGDAIVRNRFGKQAVKEAF